MILLIYYYKQATLETERRWEGGWLLKGIREFESEWVQKMFCIFIVAVVTQRHRFVKLIKVYALKMGFTQCNLYLNYLM